MSVELIVFIILALTAIATAAGMLISRHAVYAALFLVLNFATVAVLYLLLDAPFVALSQVSVYAGAIMVLFLFVIMLLGTDTISSPNALPWQRPLAILLAVVLAVESIYLVFARSVLSAVITAPDVSLNSMDSLRDMAMTLFNKFLLPFEVTSILLLVAMVGAIVIAKQEKAGQK